MVKITAGSAQKQSSSNTIAFIYTPTLRARLTRVARIHRYHRNSSQFRLLFDESAQFSERPPRHLLSLSLPEPSPFADPSQVFKAYPAFGVCGFPEQSFSRCDDFCSHYRSLHRKLNLLKR